MFREYSYVFVKAIFLMFYDSAWEWAMPLQFAHINKKKLLVYPGNKKTHKEINVLY